MKKKLFLALALIGFAGLLYKFSAYGLSMGSWKYPERKTAEGKPKTWMQRSTKEKLEDVQTDLIQFTNKLNGKKVEKEGLISQLNSPDLFGYAEENKQELNKTINRIQREITQIRRKIGKLKTMQTLLEDALSSPT